MIDVERLVRDALARHEPEAPSPDPLEAHPMAVRTRRRQVLNAVGAALIAAVIALGAASGVEALRAEAPKPADDSTETPPPPTDLGAPVPAPFEAPAQAPIVVGSDRTNGWTWMLSSSADGRCLAFTDEQGSEVNCSGPSGEPIDTYVRSPHPPAPAIAFVFGRLPEETNSVAVTVPSRQRTKGKVFVITPRGLRLSYRLYVGSIKGYERPWVPDAVIEAIDTPTNAIVASSRLARPTWARAPFTVIERVASGARELHPYEDEPPERWEIDIFRDERTGEVCLGEPGRESACGNPENPVAAWLSSWSSFETVTKELGPMGFGDSVGFAWGVYRDPVASIAVDVRENIAFIASSRWSSVDPEIIQLPDGYDGAFSIFVVECECWDMRIHRFDAVGREIGEASG